MTSVVSLRKYSQETKDLARKMVSEGKMITQVVEEPGVPHYAICKSVYISKMIDKYQ